MAPEDLDQFCVANDDRIAAIAQRFADYQPGGGCDRARILRWLDIFQNQHRELGLRLAECIEYYSSQRIIGLLQTLYQTIQAETERLGIGYDSTFYSPLGGTAESGQAVCALFRNANGLQGNTERFVQTADLLRTIFDYDNPAVFFLDDFIGTGKQVCDEWNESISQVAMPDYGQFYVCVCAAFADGIARVESETPLRVITVHRLGPRHQLMSDADPRLNRSQRNTLKRYCDTVGNNPLGFGNIAALVSFVHGTPNNAPAIIRGSEKQQPQRGLLPGWGDL